MPDELLNRLRRFHNDAFPSYQATFQTLVNEGQHPTTLFIGCSDSRVAIVLTAVAPGERMHALDFDHAVRQAGTEPAGCQASRVGLRLPLFDFEADYAKTLCCMPMIVRYKLDACRIKLSLQHWQQLDRATRQRLITEGIDGPGAQRRYRHLLMRAIVHQAKAQPVRMPTHPADPDWDSTRLPNRVRQSALDKDLALNGPRTWADLSALQRYALFKLTRPGHQNRNFRLALGEFGLHIPPG